MKWKSLFAAACAAALAVPAALAQAATGGGIPSGRVISVNFADKGDAEGFAEGETGALPETSDTFGLVPVPGSAWVDCHGATNADGISGSQKITSAYGSEEPFEAATLTYSAKNMYGSADNSGILKTWLGDGKVAQITVTNIPFDNYAVIVYFATNNGDSFKPVTVNDTKYIGTTAGSEEVTGDTETSWGTPQTAKIALGTNALRVNGLSDNLTIVGASSDGSGGARCCIAGFQIVEILPSISVNFAGDASGTNSVPIPETSDAYGLFPVPGSEWKNGFTGTGAIQVSSAYGSAETFSSMLLYKSKNIWYNTDSYDTLLQTYLDDGNNGASISMEKVPFTEYAVIVYCAGGNNAFLPVTVNGKTYTYQDNATVEGSANFGSSSVTTPTLGENALCVTGLTGSLTVQGRSGDGSGPRGGIAAIQIICTGEVVASLAPVPEAETSVVSLNFGSDRGSVPQTADTYGLVPVPGYTWTNIFGHKGTQTVTVASGKPLTKEPTVDYDSATTWDYDSATDPFFKGYLDDGDGTGDKQGDGVGASVTVSDLPFWAYDVVVYAGLDETADAAALPVRINGKLYTWDSVRKATVVTDDATAAYGGLQPTAQYGKNALRVRGLSDYDYELTVQGLPRNNSQRGGIAAIQIVERKVIRNDNIGDLDSDSDTPVHILLTNQISGDLKLPPDAILDLSSYWLLGATPPITGTLTVNEGTQIRLPKGASWTIAGTISGTLAKNAVIVDGSLATGVEVNGGTISADATYVWTGDGNTDLWSNPYNWSSHAVPTAEADVTIPLDAGAVTIELPASAVAKSVTITGPESGTATLALTSAAGETGSLTVFGQMLTTGNVTVTQSADITVQGASTMGDGSPIPQTLVVQAGFQVNGSAAGYTVASGTLSVQVPAGGGDVSVSNGGTLTVGEGGTLSASRAIATYYDKSTTSTTTSGTLSIAGRATFSTQLSLSSSGFSVELAGGTLETPYVNSSSQGLNVSAASTFVGSWPTELNARGIRGSTKTFTGAGNLTLQGEVCFKYEVLGATGLVSGDSVITADYTGELIADANSSVSLGENRPKLTVRENAKVTVTPTSDEAESGTIVFPTSMTTKPENVTYTVDVNGVAKTPSVTVNDNEDTLTLSWEADYPTLSTSVSWSSTENWTNLPEGTSFPSSGSAILDGTQEAITVTLDTDLSKMTSIFVKGNVTLVTNGTESTTIPACVKLTTGATLTVDANFSGEWTLPAGYTLQVTKGFTSFADLTLEGAVVILSDASGTAESPTKIGAPNVEFNGGLTIDASNLTLESMFNVGKTLALNGSNITLAGGGRFLTDNGTQVVNTGSYNAITGVTGLNGSLAVNSGTLALTLAGDQPTITSFLGATIAKDATLTLAGPSGWFPATGAGTLVLEGDYRPLFSAVTVGETSATDIPAKMILSATADEQDKGLVSFQTYTGTSGEVTIPDGFVAEVKPYDEAPVWVPVCVRRNSSYIDIYNVPAPNGLTGLDDEVALTLRQAAAKEGITNGNYTVQLRTKGGQTTIASPDAATLNDVLGCFDNLTATADTDKTTLTYAYDFGIVGIARNDAKTGWVVTAKVQGEGADQAGFAKGNVYVLSVTVPGETGSERNVNVQTVDESAAATGTVELTVLDTALEGLSLDDGFTLGVSVSHNAPAQ